ncbi:MAG: Gfo/Idh/MocA family oxidoreductase [Acidobacteria bacterium]|nr:Gfo/Idh/MocA family oxidoreductase [Acidobacteriota bacterium]
MSQQMGRREMVAAAMAVPRSVLGGRGVAAPSDKLVIAGVGVGGVGQSYLKGCASEKIAVLCDVDLNYAAKTFATYPAAKVYQDYRVMLEKEKGIDAVVIGTPDHTHAQIALAALELGKHVYCAKPMTRTVVEARKLKEMAAEKKLATQMSVQTCGSDDSLTTVEWVRAGAVGRVQRVDVWNDRPLWPQDLARPKEQVPVPSGLNWDLWLGNAPKRPYHPLYHPFNFRGWVDFGTGALGDMGCHTLHVIALALELGAPISVEASRSLVKVFAESGQGDLSWTRSRTARHAETFPHASMVTWRFRKAGGVLPVTWYDGGLKPPKPEGWERSKPLPDSGILFHGEKGVLWSGFTGRPRMLGEREFAAPPKTLKRTEEHYQEWITAAKGGPAGACEFGFGAYLTELTLLGAVAQRTGRYLDWDSAAMKFPGDEEATAMLRG